MKRTIWFSLITMFAGVTASPAQIPGSGDPPVTESMLGVVLTDSGRLYEGKIDRVGNLVRVVAGGRSDVIRDVNVVFTGETRQEAYQFLKSKKRADQAEDHAWLADWCRRYALWPQAIEAAKLAASLAPENAAYAKMARDIEAESRTAGTKPVIRVVGSASPVETPKPSIGPAALPAMPGAGMAKPITAKPHDLEAAFAKSVQPMMMNLCVNCHSDPVRSGSFRLTRVPEGITVSSRTIDNMTAAAAQLSRQNPSASPLLVKATTPHGGRTGALLTRTQPAFQNLEAWAKAVLATLPGEAAPAAPVPVAPVTQAAPATFATPPASTAPKPPVDPFDPAEFNKGSTPKKP